MTVNDLIDCLLEFPGGLEVVVSTAPGATHTIECLNPDVERGEPCHEERVTIVAVPMTRMAESARQHSVA